MPALFFFIYLILFFLLNPQHGSIPATIKKINCVSAETSCIHAYMQLLIQPWESFSLLSVLKIFNAYSITVLFWTHIVHKIMHSWKTIWGEKSNVCCMLHWISLSFFNTWNMCLKNATGKEGLITCWTSMTLQKTQPFSV